MWEPLEKVAAIVVPPGAARAVGAEGEVDDDEGPPDAADHALGVVDHVVPYRGPPPPPEPQGPAAGR